MSKLSEWAHAFAHRPENGDDAAIATSERRQSLAASYSGEWVAVSRDWSRLYAHGASYLAVCAGAAAQGVRNPLIARMPPLPR